MKAVEKFYCEICGAKFYKKELYEKHIKTGKCKNKVLGKKILTK